MGISQDPLSSGHLPPEQRPPKVLRLLMGLALLGLMAGLVAVIVSLAARSTDSSPGLAQIDETTYPPVQPTITARMCIPVRRHPRQGRRLTRDRIPRKPRAPPSKRQHLLPRHSLIDPGELTPNPAFFTPRPTFTPFAYPNGGIAGDIELVRSLE